MNQLTSAKYHAENVWTATPANAVQDYSYQYTADKLNRASLTSNGAVTTYGK